MPLLRHAACAARARYVEAGKGMALAGVKHACNTALSLHVPRLWRQAVFGKLAVAPLEAHNAHKPKLVVVIQRKLAHHLI